MINRSATLLTQQNPIKCPGDFIAIQIAVMELGTGFNVQEYPTRVHVLRFISLKLLIHLQLGQVHHGLIEDADAGGTLGEWTGGNADGVHCEQVNGVKGRKEEGGKGDEHGEKEDEE